MAGKASSREPQVAQAIPATAFPSQFAASASEKQVGHGACRGCAKLTNFGFALPQLHAKLASNARLVVPRGASALHSTQLNATALAAHLWHEARAASLIAPQPQRHVKYEAIVLLGSSIAVDTPLLRHVLHVAELQVDDSRLRHAALHSPHVPQIHVRSTLDWASARAAWSTARSPSATMPWRRLATAALERNSPQSPQHRFSHAACGCCWWHEGHRPPHAFIAEKALAAASAATLAVHAKQVVAAGNTLAQHGETMNARFSTSHGWADAQALHIVEPLTPGVPHCPHLHECSFC